MRKCPRCTESRGGGGPDPLQAERSALRTTDRVNVWHFGLMAHRMVCRAPKPLGGAGTTPVSEHPVPEPPPAESAQANGGPRADVHERRRDARASGLHPGIGRRARGRGRRRARVPRRPGLVQRRLPRRRRVLRAQRLPDHVGAARRVAEERRAASASAGSTCTELAVCSRRCSS